MAASLTHEEFSKHLNTTFEVRLEDSASVPLTLNQVTKLIESPGQEQFSIIFHGSKEQFLSQGTRAISHAEMGEMLLFLVPIGQNDEKFHYEAVFNRLI